MNQFKINDINGQRKFEQVFINNSFLINFIQAILK